MSEITSGHRQDGSSAAAFPEWPWLTILVQPRSTIRAVVDADPKRYVVALAVLYGIADSLSRAEGGSMADSMPLPLVFVLVIALGGVGGLISLHISGWILTMTGGWFGGKASATCTVPTTSA